MKSRKVYFDVLRLVAIFFVLYAHTGNLGIYHYTVEGGRVSYWFALAFQQLSYICNSLFFFMSGALLLGKKEDLKTIFTKRALKYVLIIIIFGILQFGYNVCENPDIEFTFETVTKCLYSNNINTTYWFLHTYLAFILMLPLLRILASGIDKKICTYLLSLLVFLDGILPIVEVIWENERIALTIPFFEMSILMPLFGYYFEQKFKEKPITPKYLLPWNVAAFVTMILYTWYNNKCYTETGSVYNFAGGLSVILMLTLYFDTKYLCEKLTSFNETPIGRIIVAVLSVFGKGTLVVYLLNNILTDMLEPIYHRLCLKITWFGATFVWLFAAIIVGVMISFVYESVKKYIISFYRFFRKSKPE